MVGGTIPCASPGITRKLSAHKLVGAGLCIRIFIEFLPCLHSVKEY